MKPRPLREQMSVEDLVVSRALFTKISVYADLLDFSLTELKSVLDKYKLRHSMQHELRTLAKRTSEMVNMQSKSLGWDKACEFGDVCDSIKEGVDKIFGQAISEQIEQLSKKENETVSNEK